jgi:RNA polymerase sporulation-specific sigma factor
MNKTKLIEDNMKLVYFVLHKYYPNCANDEDMQQIGMVGLCKAANTWDGESSKFSTYACACIATEIRMEIRRRCKTVPSVSLETQIAGSDSEFELSSILPSEDVDFDTSIEFEKFNDKLTDDEKFIFAQLTNGINQSEIARKYDVTRDKVNYDVRKIRKKWRKYNGENKN